MKRVLALLLALPMTAWADFTNPGFEAPALPGNTWVGQPTGATWVFTGNSAIANGSTVWGGGGYSSPQYGVLQSDGNPGAMTQTISGFTIGNTYRVRFWMAKGGSLGPTQLRWTMDGTTEIFAFRSPQTTYWVEYASNNFIATAVTHTFKVEALNVATNIASLIDNVHIEENPPAPQDGLRNGSFEAPGIPNGSWQYLPATVEAEWTFNPTSGIARGSGSWGTGAQDLLQYAFIQNDGFISQTITGFVPGELYHVNFYMQRRNGSAGANTANPIRVMLDGNQILPFTTYTSPTWAPFSTPFFMATSTTHTIMFQGAPTSGDRTELIDNVTLDQDAVVSPTGFQVVKGSVLAGGLSDVLSPDDSYLFARPGSVLTSTEAPVQIVFTGTSPLTASTLMSINVESACSVNNATQWVDLWDFVALAWVNFDTRTIGLNDALVNVGSSTNPSRFINPSTGEVRARLKVKTSGPALIFPWQYRVDFVRWVVGG